MPKINVLTYNAHSNLDDGQDIVDTSRPCHDPKSPHQLLKKATLIRLQSALKWEDMVDDTERDNSLITYEGVRPTPGKEMEPKKLFARKNHSFISNDCDSRLGNLWYLLQTGLQDLLLVTGSPQEITITYDGILISTIQGMVTSSAIRVLWVDMANIAALNLPWLAIEDFNCIRNWDERSGGTEPLPCSISKFNDCIDSCRLIESFSSGPKFSWCNGQKGKARILRRLDRALYNSSWIQKFDGWSSKFLKGWVTINTFEDMVIQSWGERLTGDPIFVLVKKLQRLKVAIKIWRKDNMGGIQTQIETSIADLEDLLNKILSLFGFGLGSHPEKYLGIPLVHGRVSKATVAPLIDKIRSRDSGWSGKILSFQSDPYKQKFVTIKWNKVFNHPSEGDIGIHGLRDINLSMLMKLGWGFLNAQDPWETFLRAKFFTRGGFLINYNKHSSIWNGLKEAIAMVQANSKWIIGSGRDIDFWRDCWGSEVALIDLLNIQPKIWKHCTSKLSQIIFQNDWSAPQAILDFLNTQGIDLNSLSLNNTDQDIRIWDWLASLIHIEAAFANLKQTLDACFQKKLTWALPWFQKVKINVGAVAMGLPGIAGTRAVARNHCGEVIGVHSHGVGIKTLLYLECEAVIGALFWAVE
ncbi:hypothetical protein GIB67_026499 [Kingdonia uniflora]|uniref:Uncharacterized protein n=1 Tax=Kingdonia uniflora TaxID=39325 RepID=A0A7J7PC00_9MAGN|nr:hypothetical protein GIB67_026499 [Kingdonia uniflora]